MKKFKTIDFFINMSLLLSALIFWIIQSNQGFYWYFIVGGWQLTSLVVHYFLDWFRKSTNRKFYHRIIFALLLFSIPAMLLPYLGMLYLIFLLIVSPLIAVWYTVICYVETYVYLERPLARLR